MHYDALVRRAFVLPLVLALVAPLAGSVGGCAGERKEYGNGILQYSENARRAYDDALVLFKDKDWQEAATAFREVRRKFAFSEQAPLAQLRLADIEYEQA